MRAMINLASALALAITQVAAPVLAQHPTDKMARPHGEPERPATRPAPVRPRPPIQIQPPRPGPGVQPPRPQPPRPPRPRPPVVVSPGGGYYPPGGGNWNGATIRCESRNGRYSECRAETRGGVRLVRVRGGRCQQGRTWGWRADRIWVNNGCRADFQTRAGFGGGNGGGYYPPQDNGPSTGAIIGGVAVAAGLVALLAASQKKKAPEATAAPDQPLAGTGGPPARITAATGGVTPEARPSLTTCLTEAARQIGATGGSEIRLDRIDEIEKGNGGYRFRFQLQGVYPDETRTIPTYCRATPTTLVELTFG